MKALLWILLLPLLLSCTSTGAPAKEIIPNFRAQLFPLDP
jgi:hypothetical protein